MSRATAVVAGLRALAGSAPPREARSWSATSLTGMGLDLRAGDSARPAGIAAAQTIGAFHACLRFIADTIGCMAVDVVRVDGGRRAPVDPVPLIVADPHPAPQVTASMWLTQVVWSMRARGNAFGLVTAFTPAGWPARITPLDPSSVAYEGRDGGRWSVHIDGRRTEVGLWQNGGVLWHVPFGLEPGQIIGVDVVSRAAIDLGLAHSARQYGADFYWSGGHPTAVLEASVPLTKTQAEDQQRSWVTTMRLRPREPRVLSHGLSYRPLQVTPDQAQLLQAMSAAAADVCRWFDVPPEEVGLSSGAGLTYANVEGRALQALRKLTPTMRTVQDAWSALLPPGHQVRLSAETLLMTTVKLKHDTIANDIRAGILTPNEGRALLDLAPVDGADDLLWPPYRAFADPSDTSGEETS